ncbi:hypothetical protein KZZ52_15630 [Dactylosporangium sp. AC04546]|uniref:hypothetical protein n=1 Tax=Dactylosporangium sp. AC04546 TaxID=2862460 RepID=UPI001EDFFA4E|nr:hypothetical protein [Dactylosporangium sp. AC04546]WVK86737.1 hypothetical protein KZZ52_15630 [Dactylosporangium sp. AC04546]
MIRAEAVLVAALAVVTGVALGIAFGTGTVTALGRTTPLTVVVPAGRLALIVAVATLAGLAAGLLPPAARPGSTSWMRSAAPDAPAGAARLARTARRQRH